MPTRQLLSDLRPVKRSISPRHRVARSVHEQTRCSMLMEPALLCWLHVLASLTRGQRQYPLSSLPPAPL